jgi:DNA-nicking Smr family endonuclease
VNGVNDDPFHIPIERDLDLHAFQPRDVSAVVEAFIAAAHERGMTDVRLIHGRGKGVQRGIVQAVLERHPLVAAFDDDHASHLGATLVRLVEAPGRP